VATAIAYAGKQLGCPYVFGGTGPCQDGFDCSGLVMMAYRAAGINIARTSQDQWATEMRVPASQAEPGDLVFFAGSDGTPAAPGHVGLVIGKGEFIEAYATGFPVRVSRYDVSAASLAGNYGELVGFTRPWA
jgi:cell wall-associated NlpC family hydrolase